MDSALSSSSGTSPWRHSRGAVRYPIHLRVTVLAEGHDNEALTEDLSASGCLLRVGEPLREGQQIDFLVEIPAGTLDFSVTAAVHCSGRIVRSYWDNGQPFAAVVIDEYRFQ
ncbi:MAG TPA: PilZ domain-containing protein [Acidobacteriaceae bacterium]|nr:PilZ domain-containing protein [Acidobacteriaceae bacterium]